MLATVLAELSETKSMATGTDTLQRWCIGGARRRELERRVLCRTRSSCQAKPRRWQRRSLPTLQRTRARWRRTEQSSLVGKCRCTCRSIQCWCQQQSRVREQNTLCRSLRWGTPVGQLFRSPIARNCTESVRGRLSPAPQPPQLQASHASTANGSSRA